MADGNVECIPASWRDYKHQSHLADDTLMHSLENEWNVLHKRKKNNRNTIQHQRKVDLNSLLFSGISPSGTCTSGDDRNNGDYKYERIYSLQWDCNGSRVCHPHAVAEHHPLWSLQEKFHRSKIHREGKAFLTVISPSTPYLGEETAEEREEKNEAELLTSRKIEKKKSKKNRKKTKGTTRSHSHQHHNSFNPPDHPFPSFNRGNISPHYLPTYNSRGNHHAFSPCVSTFTQEDFYGHSPLYPSVFSSPHSCSPHCYQHFYPYKEVHEGGKASRYIATSREKKAQKRQEEAMSREKLTSVPYCSTETPTFTFSSHSPGLYPEGTKRKEQDRRVECSSKKSSLGGARKGRGGKKAATFLISPSSHWQAGHKRCESMGNPVTRDSLFSSTSPFPPFSMGNDLRRGAALTTRTESPSPSLCNTVSLSPDLTVQNPPPPADASGYSTIHTSFLQPSDLSAIQLSTPNHPATSPTTSCDLSTLHPTLVFLHTLQNEVEILSQENTRFSSLLCRNVFQKELITLQLKEQEERCEVYNSESAQQWRLWESLRQTLRSLQTTQKKEACEVKEGLSSLGGMARKEKDENRQQSCSLQQDRLGDEKQNLVMKTTSSSTHKCTLDKRFTPISRPPSSPPPSYVLSYTEELPAASSTKIHPKQLLSPLLSLPSPNPAGLGHPTSCNIAAVEKEQEKSVLNAAVPSLHSSPPAPPLTYIPSITLLVENGCNPIPVCRTGIGVQTDKCTVVSTGAGTEGNSSVFSTRDQGTSPLPPSVLQMPFVDPSCLPALILDDEVKEKKKNTVCISSQSIRTNTPVNGIIRNVHMEKSGIDKSTQMDLSCMFFSRGESPIPSPILDPVSTCDASTSMPQMFLDNDSGREKEKLKFNQENFESTNSPSTRAANDHPSTATPLLSVAALPPTTIPLIAPTTMSLSLSPASSPPALSDSVKIQPSLLPLLYSREFFPVFPTWAQSVFSRWISYFVAEGMHLVELKTADLLLNLESRNYSQAVNSRQPSASPLNPSIGSSESAAEKNEKLTEDVLEVPFLPVIDSEKVLSSLPVASHSVGGATSSISPERLHETSVFPTEVLSKVRENMKIVETKDMASQTNDLLPTFHSKVSAKNTPEGGAPALPLPLEKDARWSSNSYNFCLSSLSPQPTSLPEDYKVFALPYIPPTAKPSVVALQRTNLSSASTWSGGLAVSLPDTPLVTSRPPVVLLTPKENERQAKKIGVRRASYAVHASNHTIIGPSHFTNSSTFAIPPAVGAKAYDRDRHDFHKRHLDGSTTGSPKGDQQPVVSSSSSPTVLDFTPVVASHTQKGKETDIQFDASCHPSPENYFNGKFRSKDPVPSPNSKLTSFSASRLVEGNKKKLSAYPSTSLSSPERTSSDSSLPCLEFEDGLGVTKTNPQKEISNTELSPEGFKSHPPTVSSVLPPSRSSIAAISGSLSPSSSPAGKSIGDKIKQFSHEHGSKNEEELLTSESNSSFLSVESVVNPPSAGENRVELQKPSVLIPPFSLNAASLSPTEVVSPGSTNPSFSPSSLMGSFTPTVEIRTLFLHKKAKKKESSFSSDLRKSPKKKTIRKQESDEDAFSSSENLKKKRVSKRKKQKRGQRHSKENGTNTSSNVGLEASMLSSATSSITLSTLTNTPKSRKSRKKRKNREQAVSSIMDGTSNLGNAQKSIVSVMEDRRESKPAGSLSSSSSISSLTSSLSEVVKKRIVSHSSSSDISLPSLSDSGTAAKENCDNEKIAPLQVRRVYGIHENGFVRDAVHVETPESNLLVKSGKMPKAVASRVNPNCKEEEAPMVKKDVLLPGNLTRRSSFDDD